MSSDEYMSSDELLIESRCSEADLVRSLAAGWTVTTAFGHLAFWDRVQRYALAAWERGERPVAGDEINDALEPLLTALQPRAAAELAVHTARELDAEIEATPEAVRDEIRSSGHDYVVDRAAHRMEHIDQITRAIGGD